MKSKKYSCKKVVNRNTGLQSIANKIVYAAPDPTSPSMVVAIVKGERGAERAESGQAPKREEKARRPFRGAWCSEDRQCDEEFGGKAVKQNAGKNRSE